MLEQALHYAAIGWPVFPCGKDKKPLSPHGFKDAATDAAVLRDWWARWPDAMIGLPTGFPSGIWAVDCDGGGKGTAEFEQLCSANGGLVDTLHQDTPSGGRHYLFRWGEDAPVKNTVKKLCPHVDTRGEGGYIVLAPSIRADGKAYVWGNPEIAPQPAPAWLIQRLAAKPEAAPSLSPYAQAALDAEAEKVAHAAEGERNNTLNSAAFAIGTLVGGGEIPADTAREALFQAAMKAGLNEREAMLTIQSGLDAGAERPRSVKQQEQDIALLESKPQRIVAEWKLQDKYSGPAEPRQWLVENIMPAGAVFILAGQGDVGKGMVMLDLGLKVAGKSPIPDQPEMDFNTPLSAFGNRIVRQGPVVIISAEDNRAELHRRLESLGMGKAQEMYVLPLPNTGGPMPIIVPGRNGPEMTTEWLEIRRQIVELCPVLIILDPLASFVMADINADPAVGAFTMGHMASLAEETGASVILVHHVAKTKMVNSPEAARAAIRGTTAIVDNARAAYAFWAVEEKEAKDICKTLKIAWKINKVVKGCLVKSNGPGDREIKTWIRADNGLLEVQSDQLRKAVKDDSSIIHALLTDAVRDAAMRGQPFTKTGANNGIFERKSELPEPLQTVSRQKMQGAIQELVDAGKLVMCIASGSSAKKWLDVPNGPFAKGDGTIVAGAAEAQEKK